MMLLGHVVVFCLNLNEYCTFFLLYHLIIFYTTEIYYSLDDLKTAEKVPPAYD